MWICLRAIVPLQRYQQRKNLLKSLLVEENGTTLYIYRQTKEIVFFFYLFHLNWQIERGPYYWCPILWNGCHGCAILIDNTMSQWLLVSYAPNLGALLTLSLTWAFYMCCTYISQSVETRTGAWDNGQIYATFDEIVTIFSCVYFHIP